MAGLASVASSSTGCKETDLQAPWGHGNGAPRAPRWVGMGSPLGGGPGRQASQQGLRAEPGAGFPSIGGRVL
jgi:hypothetical protein